MLRLLFSHDQLERVQAGEKYLLTPAVFKWAQKMMAKEQAEHPQPQMIMNTEGQDGFQGEVEEATSATTPATTLASTSATTPATMPATTVSNNVSFMELKQTRVQHRTRAQSSSRLRVAAAHKGSYKAGTRKGQPLSLAKLAASAVRHLSLPGQTPVTTRFASRSQEWQPDLPRQAAAPERSPWSWRPRNQRLPGQSKVRLLASEATSGTSPIGLKDSSKALLEEVRKQLQSDAFI